MTRKGKKDEQGNELLRVAWALSGKGKTAPAGGELEEPHGAERKKLVRKLRQIQKNGTEPVNIQAATMKAQQDSLRFIEALFANADRARNDPTFLQNIPPERRYERMVKPWKGRKGRAAAKGAATTSKRKDELIQRAIELHRQGHTEVEIAKMIGREERTVRRYLTGR